MLAAVLPVGALTVAAAWTAAEGLRSGLEERIIRAAHALALSVEQEVRLTRTTLEALTLEPLPAGDFASLAPRLERLAARSGASLAVTDLAGREWARASASQDQPSPHSQAPDAAARALENQAAAVSNLLDEGGPGPARLAMFLPMPDAQGRPAALLGASFPASWLSRQLGAHMLPAEGFIILCDAQGREVARVGSPSAVPPRPVAWRPGDPASFSVEGPGGTPWLLGLSAVAGMPGWTLMLAVPLDDHMAALRSPTRWLMVGGLVAGLLSGLLAWALGRQLLRPARALASHARAIAAGGGETATLSVPPPAIRELEELRQGFAEAEAVLRRRAQDAAGLLRARQESEARLRQVLEQLPVGVSIAEAPSGRLLFHNARAEQILGHALLPAAEVEEYRHYGALHPHGTSYRPEEHPLARAVLYGESVDGEQTRYRRGDGRITWLSVHAAPIRDAAGRIALAVCAFTDIGPARAAAEALASAEARSRVLFQSAPVAAYVADAATRRILDCNATATAMLGHTPEALRAMYLTDLDAGPRHGTARPRGPDGARETRHRHRDGTLRDVLVTTVPLELDGRPVLYAIALDVTEQRRTEAALATSEARLRMAMESAGLSSWEMDLRTGIMSRAGRIISSRPGLPLSGHTVEEFLAQVVHPEDVPHLRDSFNLLATGQATRNRVEYRARSSEGPGWLHVESHGVLVETDPETGAPLRAAGTSRDITAQREAEEALRASEERFRFALQAAGGIGTWDWDVPSGRMIADSGFAALFGVAPARAAEGVPAERFLARIHPADRQRVQALLDEAMRPHASGDYAAEHRVLDRRGRIRWVVARGRCYHDLAGQPVRFPGAVIDITARKEGEERQALLAHEVDHRAKNALAVAQSVVALTRAEDPAAFRAAVSGRITALARAHTLLARESWAGAALEAILEAEIAPYQDQADDAVRRRIQASGPAVELLPSAVQPMAMALHELTTNAAKHGALSAQGGEVDVEWERTATDGLRLVWRERGGPTVQGPPTRRGFGATLMEATMRRQLGGQARMDWRPEGLQAEMELPARHLRWRGGTALGRVSAGPVP